MNDLEMIKAFAELEGIKLTEHRGHLLRKDDQGNMFVNGVTMGWYNPITDLALNCAARDKYEVEVLYYPLSYSMVSIGNTVVGIDGKNEVPRAVIECILKENGSLVE